MSKDWEIDNPIRIIIDTNLWISFLIGRKLDKLIKMFEDPWFELVNTPILQEEVLTVAKREKFRKWFSTEKVDALQHFMEEEMVMVDINEIPRRCRDPKDDYLLELAIQSHAIFLVSGDDDLLNLGQIEDCQIMTVAQFENEVIPYHLSHFGF